MDEPRYCYRHPDRETGLSCSECGRPICTECMTPAPVGIRCPEHSGKPQGVAKVARTVQRVGGRETGLGLVTRALIGINVAVYLLELAGGAGVTASSGTVYEHGVLFGPYVEHGDWWRLLTAAFLHYGPIHLAMNMAGLYFVGTPLEYVLGRWRFLSLYLVSGLAGSAGALVNRPLAATVGASGAIFGILGAAFILERRGNYVFGGQAAGLILINLLFTFVVPNIAIGGHIGGLIGGGIAMLALSHFRRSALVSAACLLAIAVASVAVAYYKVRGYA
jgi:membrane associated rhomboid family serine protease